MRSRKNAGRLYEIPCLVCAVLMVLAVVLPIVVKAVREKPASDVAPADSTVAPVTTSSR